MTTEEKWCAVICGLICACMVTILIAAIWYNDRPMQRMEQTR